MKIATLLARSVCRLWQDASGPLRPQAASKAMSVVERSSLALSRN